MPTILTNRLNSLWRFSSKSFWWTSLHTPRRRYNGRIRTRHSATTSREDWRKTYTQLPGHKTGRRDGRQTLGGRKEGRMNKFANEEEREGPSAYVCTLAYSIWLSRDALWLLVSDHFTTYNDDNSGWGDTAYCNFTKLRIWQSIHGDVQALCSAKSKIESVRKDRRVWKVKIWSEEKSFCRPTEQGTDNSLYNQRAKGPMDLCGFEKLWI